MSESSSSSSHGAPSPDADSPSSPPSTSPSPLPSPAAAEAPTTTSELPPPALSYNHSPSPSLPPPAPYGFTPLPYPALVGFTPLPSPAPDGFSSPATDGFSPPPSSAPDSLSPSPAPNVSPPPKPSAMPPPPDNSILAPSSFASPAPSPSSLSPAPSPASQSPSPLPSPPSLPPPPASAPLPHLSNSNPPAPAPLSHLPNSPPPAPAPLPHLPNSPPPAPAPLPHLPNSPPSSPAPLFPSPIIQPQPQPGTVLSRPPPPLVPGTPSSLTPPNTLMPNDVPSTSKPPGQATPTTPNAKLLKNAEAAHSSSKPSSSTINYVASAVVGITAAGVFIVLVAVFFMISKKRRRSGSYGGKFRSHGSSSIKLSDGYYHGVTPSSVNVSAAEATHNSDPSFLSLGSSYGSYGSTRYYAGSGSMESGGPKSGFTFEEMIAVTNGFSMANVIGEGGFGCVYQGTLPDGRTVAVKQLKAGSGQGEREFKAEVEIISRIHHRHLVELVGYCIAENHRLLVYEFVTNDTLEHHLHDKNVPVMDWQKRMKIAIGSARGLAYLHEDCNPKIIHRDIKSANILIDDSFEAKVADFGLAKLSNDTFTHVSTRVVGTFGYMAPEYAASGKLTDRSDVFSFGVVLLELITGRKPVDISQPVGEESLVEWARPLLVNALETGDFEELVDPRLEKNYVESSMHRMIEAAAACVRHSAPKRPRMVQVLRSLDLDEGMSDLSNGMKFGHSRVYDSNTDLEMFRKIAFASQIYNAEGDVFDHV